MNSQKRFGAVVACGPNDAVFISIPFDPNETWGRKPRHHVTGWIDGHSIRGPLVSIGEGPVIVLNPSWRHETGVCAGDNVSVTLVPEGPHRDALETDFAAALQAEPKAAEFFDGLAQFYRKAYLTWIDATKKRPEERARRIAETVKLLRNGVKQRPKS
jgi:hypothetical protein